MESRRVQDSQRGSVAERMGAWCRGYHAGLLSRRPGFESWRAHHSHSLTVGARILTKKKELSLTVP